MSLTRGAVDRRMKRLRGELYALVEASLPEGQQEGFKRAVKQYTQTTWKGVLRDAGLLNNEERSHEAD